MNAIAAAALSTIGVTFILAATAVLIVRLAVAGSASADRASILGGIADVIRAIRGKSEHHQARDRRHRPVK
jgi:hypothetical protein